MVNVLGGAVRELDPTAVLCRRSFLYAVVAQMVEYQPSKLGVAGSMPVSRSNSPWTPRVESVLAEQSDGF